MQVLTRNVRELAFVAELAGAAVEEEVAAWRCGLMILRVLE
jgi:hypothetical protein